MAEIAVGLGVILFCGGVVAVVVWKPIIGLLAAACFVLLVVAWKVGHDILNG